MKPLISVVVPTYKRPHLLARCLDALLSQTFDARSYEIIVVDDGADEATRLAVEAACLRSPVTLTYLPQLQRGGPAAARNKGWQLARGQLIGFTDDDCIPDAGWLQAGVQALANGADVVSGRVVVPLDAQSTEYDRTTALLEAAEFVTANCFCRRSVLEQVGGLEERFDIAWREDSDLQFKLLEAGFPIAKNPDMVIVHPCRPAAWWSCLKDERKNAYDALLYKRHPTLFRKRIPRYLGLVTLYYAFVISFLMGIGFGLAGLAQPARVAFGIWAVLFVGLVVRRLRGGGFSLTQFGQIALTTALTPFLSVYWRLYGAAKHRTLYW